MTRRRLRYRAVRAAILGALLLAGVFTGSLRAGASAERFGQVQFGGTPVPGATVIVTQGDKRITTVTDAQGIYRFADLADGVWSLRIEMLGFEPLVQDITVSPTAEPTLSELKLMSFDQISARPAEVIRQGAPASAATPPVQAARPAQPANTPRPAAGAPAAGAAAGAAAGGPPASPAAPAGTALSDSDPMSAADGLLINGSVNNGGASPFAQSGAFGNNRPGGRSLYNGSVGSIFGTSAWDARPYSFARRESSKPDYEDVQFLGTFGGPIKIPGIRTRPTLFLGYQRTADTNAITQSALMPTLLERSGDFSQTTDPFGNAIQIKDPLTGLPFAGNVIPQERLSPQAQSLLNYYPRANVALTDGVNYQIPTTSAVRSDSFQARISTSINPRNQLSGTFSYQNTRTDSTSLFGFNDDAGASALDATANWQRRLSLFSSFRLRYQFTRVTSSFTPYFANRTNVSGNAGINGNNQDPENWGPPALVLSSVASLSSGQFSDNSTFTNGVNGEYYWSHGRHYVTFGGDLKRVHSNIYAQQNARGNFGFSGALSGSDMADFLLGLPNSSAIAYGNPDKFFRSWMSDAYVNDDWRINPVLTLTAGARWEFETPIVEGFGRLANLDIAPGYSAVVPVVPGDPVGGLTGTSYPESLIRADPYGIQPRLGVAWRPIPGSSVVVRGGYGIYRNTNVYQSIATLLAQQGPFSTTASVQNSPEYPLTLANGFPAAGTAVNTFAVDADLKVGFAQNWQVSLQRDLPASLTIVGTYLGTKGSRLLQQILPNTIPEGAPNACPTCPVGFIYLTSGGSSLRHSGQIQLRRRLRSGFTAQAQYTISTAHDDATAFGGASFSGGAVAQDWTNLDAEWGPSNFDQRHLVTAQVQYTTGVGVAGGALLDGVTGALVKGWTFTTNLTTGSALPVTPTYLASVQGTGVTGSVRGSTTGVTAAPADGYYLNPEAFSTPAAGQWGTAGRNSQRGPAQFQLNAGVMRTFTLSQRMYLDWRIDATNVLNRVIFSNINTTVGSSQFGLPNRANTMRKLQSTIRLRF